MKWLWLVPFALGAFPVNARAESIWERRDPRSAFLFYDNRARNIGDVVTIAISESTTTNERETRASEKTTSASITTTFTGSTASSVNKTAGSLNFNPTNATDRKFSGSSQLTSGRTFIDTMAATVVDILPNGNLVVEGYRSRVVSGEERMLKITGIVRQQDIGTANTVSSGAIANFRISYLGRGPESRYMQPSYFSRAMNLLWPW